MAEEYDIVLEVDPEYQDVKKTFSAAGVSRTDWTDKVLLDNEKYMLKEYDQATMLANAKLLFARLETGISEKDGLLILEMAWNILKPGKKFERVFPKGNKFFKPTDTDIDKADDTIINDTKHQSSIAWTAGEELQCCQAAGYTCATLMRLFTRTEKNYISAKTTIKNNYNNFYQKAYSIKPFEIHDIVVKDLHHLFQNRPLYRNTAAGLFYFRTEAKAQEGLLNAVCMTHLKSSGMHSWPLFQKVSAGLNAPTPLFLTALRITATERGLAVIKEIITKFEADEATLAGTSRERKTYEFARLFDPSMFADLQTKNCRPLALVLGNLAKMTAPDESGDVLEIVAIKNISKNVKKLYEDYAEGVYSYFCRSKQSAAKNPIFEKVLEKNK